MAGHTGPLASRGRKRGGELTTHAGLSGSLAAALCMLQVVDGLRVAKYYTRYGRFWLDALATVPFVYLVRGRQHIQGSWGLGQGLRRGLPPWPPCLVSFSWPAAAR